MSPDTDLVHQPGGSVAVRQEFSREQIEVIKDSVAQGTTDTELQFFLEVCRRTGLDPFARQVFAVKRWDARAQREVMAIQTSIDGYRLIAQRSGEYEGQQGPWWCGADGVWREIWIDEHPPVAAKVGVWRRGFREPIVGLAHWTQYAQRNRKGVLSPMWERMGPHMLAKCAEALALRRGFSAETAGIYTREEMTQADVIDVPLNDDPEEHRQLLDDIEKAWTSTPEDLRTAPLDEVLQHASQSVAWARAVLTKVDGWSTVAEDQAVDVDVVQPPAPETTDGATPASWEMSAPQRKRLMALLKEADVDDAMRGRLVGHLTKGRTTSSKDLTNAEYDALVWVAQNIRDGLAIADVDRDGSLILTKNDGGSLDVEAIRTYMQERRGGAA